MLGYNFSLMQPDEVKFIVDSWVRSFRDSPWAGCIANDQYQEVMRGTVNGLLARGVRVVVATTAEGPRRVCGYIATEAPDLIHYIYVKNGSRKLGLANELLKHGPQMGRLTFRTPASEFLLKRGFSWTPVPARLTEWRPPGVPSSAT